MHLERLNDALAFLQQPRATDLPLQFSTLRDIRNLPIWANAKRHRAGLEQKNDLDDPVLFNLVFKLPSLPQLDRLYYHTIYESVSRLVNYKMLNWLF